MSAMDYPPEFIKLLKSVTGKRPRTVIEHILKHGQITNEELKDVYGYNHPPRAIRDVREQGIPIETSRVAGSDGRKIAAYKFGDPRKVRETQLSGRTAFTRKLREALVNKYGSRCNIYLEPFASHDLQIDHRIPFEIAGDDGDLSEDTSKYMLVSASANRAKSWSCENCGNWHTKKIEVCMSCYWASPESYSHVAMRDIRRLDLLWSEDDVEDYDALVEIADQVKESVPEYVKAVLRRHITKD